MARQAAARGVRGGPRVLIVPGIMGSKIGRKRFIFDDVIWLDPIDVAAGNLAKLVLTPDITSILSRYPDDHLVILHDALSSRIPWVVWVVVWGRAESAD